MKKLKVAVIGLGVGKNHIKGFIAHENAEVVAIVDTDESRLATVGDEYGIANRYTSADDLFANEKLDIVSVATPNFLHKPLSLQAFENGCHVLCEKPMAMNAEEAEEMIQAADKHGRRIMINFSYRFLPSSWALKSQVETGFLGEVYAGKTRWVRRDGIPNFGSWFGKKKLAGGGPLIDIGVHRLDFALWLMGYPKPTCVLACAHNKIASERAKAEGVEFDVEDYSSAQILFENGISLQLEAAWACHIKGPEEVETAIFGSKGGLRQKNDEGTWDFHSILFSDANGAKLDTEVTRPKDAPPSAMYHFVDAILNDTPNTADGQEGYRVMKILDAIYLSAETGKPVTIDEA